MRKNRLQKIITGLYASPVAHMATGFDSLNTSGGQPPTSDKRFFCVRTDSIAIFTVTAATEREARAQLPHAHLIFVARIRQGVGL